MKTQGSKPFAGRLSIALSGLLFLLAASPMAALALGAPAVAASDAVGPGAPDLLLRLWEVRSGDDSPVTSEELLLFRDGLILLLSDSSRDDSQVLRAEVGQTELEALKASLVAGRVDQQAGRCDVSGLQSILEQVGPGENRETVLSWFGVRGRRVRHFPVGHGESGSGPFGRACSADLVQVLEDTLSTARGALTGPTATADPDQHYPRSLFFKVQNSLRDDATCDDGTFIDDFYLFRDGLLVRRFQSSDRHYLISRAFVPPEMRQTLNGILTEEGIGGFRGLCRTWFFVPFVVDGRCLDYTWESGAEWFGRGGRRGIVAGDDSSETTCSIGRLRVRDRLMHTILNALSFATVQSVEGVLPRVSGVEPRPGF